MKNTHIAQQFMHLAIKEAQSGIIKDHGGPFGAVIVKDGKIISKSHNTVIKDNDPTCHAEMNAIRLASKKLESFDLSGCEIYTTAEPCPMCLSALYWAGIKKAYYGAPADDTGSIGFIDKKLYDIFKGKENSSLKKIQLSRDECLKLFDEWKRKKDKIKY